jgi:hypothetical protein
MTIRTTIVGTRFRGPEAVAALARLRPGDRLRLMREPDNEHDPNAVAVYSRTMHIGYIPRGIINRDVADRIMSADSVAAVVTAEAIIERGEVRFAPRIEVRDHFDDLFPDGRRT